MALILTRTLAKDLADYNNEELTREEQQEETGWELVQELIGWTIRFPYTGKREII